MACCSRLRKRCGWSHRRHRWLSFRTWESTTGHRHRAPQGDRDHAMLAAPRSRARRWWCSHPPRPTPTAPGEDGLLTGVARRSAGPPQPLKTRPSRSQSAIGLGPRAAPGGGLISTERLRAQLDPHHGLPSPGCGPRSRAPWRLSALRHSSTTSVPGAIERREPALAYGSARSTLRPHHAIHGARTRASSFCPRARGRPAAGSVVAAPRSPGRSTTPATQPRRSSHRGA